MDQVYHSSAFGLAYQTLQMASTAAEVLPFENVQLFMQNLGLVRAKFAIMVLFSVSNYDHHQLTVVVRWPVIRLVIKLLEALPAC